MSFLPQFCKRKVSHTLPKGFTIVELLIVIVIIAILAAITIVAYTGIQNRARESATVSGINSVQKKIATFQIDNTDSVPITLDQIGITSTDQTKYQYTPNTSIIPNTYCLTVSNGTYSAFTTSIASKPQPGACPGHGANGEVAIANLFIKPRGEDAAPWGKYSSPANAASGSTGTVTGLPNNITSAFRYEYIAATVGGPYINIRSSFTADSDLTASVYVRSASALSIRMSAEMYPNTSGGARAYSVDGNYVTLSPNTWTRLNVYVPYDAVNRNIIFTMYPAGTTPATTVLFASAAMLTKGNTLYNYADGYSTNWIWDNSPNASISRGQAL